MIDAFVGFVARHGPEGASDWLGEATAAMETPPDVARLRVAVARAGRMLGDRSAASFDTVGMHEAVGDHWTMRDFGRAALVLAALQRTPVEEQTALVEQLVRRGEMGEQESLLKLLPVLPRPDRFLAAAIDACRTNSASVFAAIALDNPYARDHFPEANFNQLVLKAIFIGLPVERIVGLEERVNAELVRMVRDYADERRAAGRTVPDDVGRVEGLMEGRS
jgi:hypothetical protein